MLANPFQGLIAINGKLEETLQKLAEAQEHAAALVESLAAIEGDKLDRVLDVLAKEVRLQSQAVVALQQHATALREHAQTHLPPLSLDVPAPKILLPPVGTHQVMNNQLRSPSLYYNVTQAQYYRCMELVVENLLVLAPAGVQTTVDSTQRTFPSPLLFTRFSTRGITQCAGRVSLTFEVNSQPVTGNLVGQAPDPLLVVQDWIHYDLLAQGVPRFLEGDLVFGPAVATNPDIVDHTFLITLEFVRMDPVSPEDVPQYWRA